MHLSESCTLPLEVQETVLGVHRQVQLRVAQRLPSRELDGDGQPVLLRVREGVDSPALGFRHGGAHARQLPAVLHEAVREDEVRQEEGRDAQDHPRDDARVSLPELTPAQSHRTTAARPDTHTPRGNVRPTPRRDPV